MKMFVKGCTRFMTIHGVRSLSSQAAETFEMPHCDYVPPPYKGPLYKDVIRIRSELLSPALAPYYSEPLLIHDGHMQWLYDHTGKRYLDLLGGIVTVSLGHSHTKIVEAATAQMKKVWHTTHIYLHPKIHEYAERLTSTLPEPLKVVYFVNSGSEANDLAMMLARIYTGNYDIVTFRHAYHGVSPYTSGLTALSTWKQNIPHGFGIHHVMNPDPYQGLWGGFRDCHVQSVRANESEVKDGMCLSTDKYLAQLEELMMCSLPNRRLAAFFAESIQGVGGVIQYPLGYLKKAFDLVRGNGGLCVADEVQTGFGRTGDHFWGFEGHGVIPDIVTMAKGIGNGFPLAAVVTTTEVAKSLTGALHFNTFGGNPIATAVGLAVLEEMEKQNTQQQCKEVGTYFIQKLAEFRDEFEIVGDVRGKGLMMAIELVEDSTSRKPLNNEAMAEILEVCKDHGVLIGRGGFFRNVFRITPPMCITRADVDFTVSVLRNAINQVQQKV